MLAKLCVVLTIFVGLMLGKAQAQNDEHRTVSGQLQNLADLSRQLDDPLFKLVSQHSNKDTTLRLHKQVSDLAELADSMASKLERAKDDSGISATDLFYLLTTLDDVLGKEEVFSWIVTLYPDRQPASVVSASQQADNISGKLAELKSYFQVVETVAIERAESCQPSHVP